LSHDDGIDFVCSNPEINNKITYGQSKYNIKEKSELDTIMSKFYNWENQTQTGKSDLNQEDLFGSFFEAKQKDGESPIYVIITLSKLDKIIEKYEKSILSSLSFYKKLKSEKRLIIFDGNKILNLIKSYYVK
jgi:hypothetical protein